MTTMRKKLRPKHHYHKEDVDKRIHQCDLALGWVWYAHFLMFSKMLDNVWIFYSSGKIGIN